MCASFGKNIFLRIYKLFGIYYCIAQGHCSPKGFGFMKIGALHNVPFTSKSFVSFLIGRRRPWRNHFEEKRLTRNKKNKFAALELQLQRSRIED